MSCWGQQLLSYFTHYTKKCKWFMSGLLTTWDLGPQWADTKTLPPYFLSSPLLSFLSFSLVVKEILITEHKIGRTEDFTAMNLKKTQNKKTFFFLPWWIVSELLAKSELLTFWDWLLWSTTRHPSLYFILFFLHHNNAPLPWGKHSFFDSTKMIIHIPNRIPQAIMFVIHN